MSEPRTARVVATARVADGVRRVWLELGGGGELGQRAGQYILLHARAADGTIRKRAYSIASPPAPGPGFALCVRRVAEGGASAFVHELVAGDEVRFTGPWGKLVVADGAPEREVVLVATGSAISCCGALAADLLARSPGRRVRLLWGLRHEADLHGADELDALAVAHPGFCWTPVLSAAGPGWTGRRGRVTGLLAESAELSARRPRRSDALYLLAGNGAMVLDAEEILRAGAVPDGAWGKEVFFTPGAIRVPLRERELRAANRRRPGRAVVGLALHAGTPATAVAAALGAALEAAGLEPADVRNVAVADRASDEPGLAAAAALGLPVERYLPAELGGEPGASVSERLACVSAGGGRLLQARLAREAVAVAVAEVAPVEVALAEAARATPGR